MVEINLLPWREAKRTYETRQLKQLLGATLLCCLLILGGCYGYWLQQEAHLVHRIALLQQSAAARGLVQARGPHDRPLLDQKLKNHAVMTHQLFKAFVAMGGLCLTSMRGSDHAMLFAGEAQSAIDVTGLLTQWQTAALFTDIKIKTLKETTNHRLQFQVEGLFKSESDEL